jgi:hypothetical protein
MFNAAHIALVLNGLVTMHLYTSAITVQIKQLRNEYLS